MTTPITPLDESMEAIDENTGVNTIRFPMESPSVTARLKPDVDNAVGLLAERNIREQTGCESHREGRTYRFSIPDATADTRIALLAVIEETGAFVLEDRDE